MCGGFWWALIDRGVHRPCSPRRCLRSGHLIESASMCRNITTLRGLEPPATPEEIEAAARQYVRKVSGVQKTSAATVAAFEDAVARVSAATAQVLNALPPRRVPPRYDPPIRRMAAQRA